MTRGSRQPKGNSQTQSASEAAPGGDPAGLARVRELLERAWEQPAEQRLAWLMRNCDSPDLLAEAKDLLAADSEAGEFLGPAFMEQAMGMLEGSPVLAGTAQRQIGKYRIVKPIGHGGMGEVFLAERTVGDFQQEVAIKLARRFDDSPERRRRFMDEQRILARLEHPNIARLIDAGIWDGDDLSAQGRPYLVMEYVDGLPITEYCNERGLELDARLELFGRVCEAVHYAHRNLVLHRDLKPENILVSSDGHVKLLDFGIATMLAEDKPSIATHTLLMTPQFASPEQVRGEALTTSTDVYALGLLLYELVCGHRPYDLEDCTPAEVERRICDLAPAAPSSKVIDRSRAKRLKGDLDKIVLKALGKEPEHRYPSARALSEDVQNFIEGLPVRAQPDSPRYRIAKFVSRHRWESVTGSIAVVALVAATVIATVSASQARSALAQQRLEASKSAQVVEFLRNMFAAADPRQTGGEVYSVQDILETGTQRIDALAGQPEVQGLLLSELGQIQTTLGNYDTAVALLERAAAIEAEALGREHPAVADTLHRRSIAEDERGNLAGAESAARRALEIRRSSLAPDDPGIGESMDRLGAVVAAQGRYDEARPLMQGAVSLLIAAAGERDKRTLTAMHNLAWLQGRLGDYADSEATYRHVIRLAQPIYGPNDPELLVTRDSLAVVLRRQGKLDEAEAIYRDVLVRRIETLGEHHQEVGFTSHNLARLLFERGAYEEAVALFELALANWRDSLGPTHVNVGIGLSNLGRVQESMGRAEDAINSYRRSIDILELHGPGYLTRLGDTSLRLGRLLAETGVAESGRPLLERALMIREEFPENEAGLAEARLELGNCLLVLDEIERGQALIQQGLDIIASIAVLDADLQDRAREIEQRLGE